MDNAFGFVMGLSPLIYLDVFSTVKGLSLGVAYETNFITRSFYSNLGLIVGGFVSFLWAFVGLYVFFRFVVPRFERISPFASYSFFCFVYFLVFINNLLVASS